MEIFECPDYTAQRRDQLTGGETDPSGVAHLGLVWRDKARHVVAQDGGKLVAHAGWVEAEAYASGHVFLVLGLGSVLVHPDARGRGMGTTIVQAAMSSMRRVGRPIGLLFCLDTLVPFYERLGWMEVTRPISVDQPGGPILMPTRSCWIPLHDDAELPAGDLSLVGLPF